MIQEDKELLLKDLSARLSCGVKVLDTAEDLNEICELDSIMTSRKYNKVFVGLTLPDDAIMTGIEMVKPYLRPMSSMTEEERREYDVLASYFDGISMAESIDWLNSHHFDYRALIDRGLAIEVTSDNNPYN